ncbi:hypothetical protein A2U01_0046623, partial [Trifolium medium]|nr:hypothetical protein [Trifolium medium]
VNLKRCLQEHFGAHREAATKLFSATSHDDNGPLNIIQATMYELHRHQNLQAQEQEQVVVDESKDDVEES